MIIKLRKYNEVRELLIGNGNTGSWGHICYQDGGQRVSVTMVAVHMGVKEMWMQTGHRGHIQSASELGIRADTCIPTVEQSENAIRWK